jgi:hypothetical protein
MARRVGAAGGWRGGANAIGRGGAEDTWRGAEDAWRGAEDAWRGAEDTWRGGAADTWRGRTGS